MVHRKIHALMFELTRGDEECYLVAWPDETLPSANRPTYGQDWLDLGVGDAVTVRDLRWRVSRVLLYRVHPAEANGTAVRTGRAWLREVGG